MKNSAPPEESDTDDHTTQTNTNEQFEHTIDNDEGATTQFCLPLTHNEGRPTSTIISSML